MGVLKYVRADARDILERASARETTARVAAGAIAKTLLRQFGITIGSHIVSMGDVVAGVADDLPADLNAAADASPVRTIDKQAEARMIAAIDHAKATGDTLGGCFEVVVRGVPAGLGSHVSWDRRLDGRLAQALMSIQAMKGVEIGLGFEAARRFGSQVHDVIEAGYTRASNRAGGLEGGMTTGGPIVLRVAMKPLSTLMRPLATVNIQTGQAGEAVTERSDVAALAAAGVVGEAMVAIVIADALLEKFGGDSLSEMRRNHAGYQEYLEKRGGSA